MTRRELRLSPHFSLSEFDMDNGMGSPVAADKGLVRLCVQVLEPMRVHFGRCIVTSGYRTVLHNRAVGGAPASRHLYDRFPDTPAADVKFDRGTPQQWAAMAITMKVGGVGLYSTHVHLDQRRGRARW